MVSVNELANIRPPTAFEKVVREFSNLEAVKLARPELGDELNFLDLTSELQSFIDCARELHELPIGALPQSLADRGQGAFEMLRNRLSHLREFGLSKYDSYGNDPVRAKAALTSALRTDIRSFFEQIAPVFGYAGALQLSAENLPVSQALRGARAEIESSLSDTKAKGEEIGRLLALAQENVQKTGIARHAVHFSQEAATHAESARNWLFAVGVIGAITAIAAVANAVSVRRSPGTLTPAQSAQVIVAKLLVFSVLASATVWCGRVYRAHRHNFVVNRHRQNALSSFETFADATDDGPTKNAVLIQATQSIFAPQPSGYSQSDADAPNSTQLVELIRTVTSAK